MQGCILCFGPVEAPRIRIRRTYDHRKPNDDWTHLIHSRLSVCGSLIDPVNLLEWNSDGRCVLLDLSAFLAIAAHISKHAISEDDHVIISYGEVRIPATLAKQSSGKRPRERVCDLVWPLKLYEGPHSRLRASHGGSDIAPEDPTDSQRVDLENGTDAKTLSKKGSFHHHVSIACAPATRRAETEAPMRRTRSAGQPSLTEQEHAPIAAIADVAGIQRGGDFLAQLVAMNRRCQPRALLSSGNSVRSGRLRIPL